VKNCCFAKKKVILHTVFVVCSVILAALAKKVGRSMGSVADRQDGQGKSRTKPTTKTQTKQHLDINRIENEKRPYITYV
jgi:preprotein translocase subunit SecG